MAEVTARGDRRVGETRAATARGLLLAGAFAVATVVVAIVGRGRWEVVHLAVAGGGSLVVSAAALHLALTWSGAPAPPRWASEAQRWLLALGVAVAVLARPRGADGWVLAGAVTASAGFAALAVLLVLAAARARQQRYRVQTWSYAVAALWGAVGVVLGGLLATGHGAEALWRVHPVVMLWGFIGTVVVATLPTFAATTLRMKPSPLLTQQRLGVAVATFVCGLVVAVTGGAVDRSALGAVGLGLAALGLATSWLLMPRPDRRAFDYAGPRGLGIAAGALWWVVVTGWVSAEVGGGTWPTAGPALAALLVGGLAQMLWAGIAYLAPVLRAGGPERLSAGFALMRSWIGLIALNAAGVAVAVGSGVAAAVLVGVAALDTAWRVARLVLTPPPTPPTSPS